MKIIKSLQNQVIKDIAKLKDKKYRDEIGLFVVEGEHLVRMANESNCIKTILVDEDYLEKYIELISEDNTIVVNSAIINKLSYTKSPQGIIGVCSKKEVSNKDIKRVVILDGLQDPGNVGTLLRSALAFCYDEVIISNDSVDLYNDKVVRASQGAIFKLDVIKKDLNDVYKELNELGFKIFATGLTNTSITLEKVRVSRDSKFALVLGNEGNGISEISKIKAHEVIKIDMSNKIDSLNVSVAGSIAMYYLKGEIK